MRHTKCKSLESWVRFAEEWLVGQKSKGARSLYLPAGNTCVPVYQAMNYAGSILNEFELYQIDEVITGAKKGLFSAFFREHLGQLRRPVHTLGDGEACADLAWLGLGLNGHVGFHEPGIPEHFNVGCIHLDQKTCQTLELEPDTWGVTYGIDRFLKSKAILMFVRGASKAQVLEDLLNQNSSLPATALSKHSDFQIVSEGI